MTLKSSAELECSAYGVPSPTIQWFKNGEPIYPSDYFQFSPNHGDMKIMGIIAQDEGYYQCLASNELNTIQSVAKLSVLQSGGDQNELSLDSSANEDYDAEDQQSRVAKKQQGSGSMVTTKRSNFFSSLSTLGPLQNVAMALSGTQQPVIHLSAPTDLKVTRTSPKSIHLQWRPPSIVRDAAQTNQNQLIYYISWKQVILNS